MLRERHVAIIPTITRRTPQTCWCSLDSVWTAFKTHPPGCSSRSRQRSDCTATPLTHQRMWERFHFCRFNGKHYFTAEFFDISTLQIRVGRGRNFYLNYYWSANVSYRRFHPHRPAVASSNRLSLETDMYPFRNQRPYYAYDLYSLRINIPKLRPLILNGITH